MPSLWAGYVNILKLDTTTFQTVKEGRDGFMFALKLFILVGLVVGLGKLVDGANVLQQPTLPGIAHDVAAGLDAVSVALPPVLAGPISEVSTAVTELETTLSQYQPPLGKGVSRIVRLVGDWLSTPLTMMAAWLQFMLIIFLFAKALHGRGSLDQHISLLTLAVAPQVLLLFSYLSFDIAGFNLFGFAGRLLTIAAWIWSLVIVIKGLAVAHEFKESEAVKVLLLFVVAIVVLGLLGTAVTGFVVAGFF